MMRFLLILMLLVSYNASNDLLDVSQAVFGDLKDRTDLIPAAFGDFNSDKLTDLVVLQSDQRSVAVRLAREQSVVPASSQPIFQPAEERLECNCPAGRFTTAAPADFNGDGGLDLLMVGNSTGQLTAYIYWAGRDEAGRARLDCTSYTRIPLPAAREPLVFDYNGDYIADLLTQDEAGRRTAHVFNSKGTFTVAQLPSNQTDPLKLEHASGHLDLTGDGRPDLVLTTVTGLELYRRGEAGLEYLCLVPWPAPALSSPCSPDNCIGQPVFLDFSLSGSLSLVLPVCFDMACANSTLYLVPLPELAACPTTWTWLPMSLELAGLRFLPRHATDSPLSLLAPRVGDVDLDGYPDLLMTTYNASQGQGKGEVQLLLNVPCGELSRCSPVWRQFQLQPGYTAGTTPAVTSVFFDLYEDGRMDLLTVGLNPTGQHVVAAYQNATQDSDAYFMKVTVLTGSCYKDCAAQSADYVPYGTNTGGQLVSYRSQRPGQEVFDSYQSVAVQLAQTASFALGLPYTIFGLGMAPNFVDYLDVNISGLSHRWPQIIPNSQLYVIPFPADQPSAWDAKLIIFTSKNIVFTGLALVGTCALCTAIILLLHTRERRQDAKAKLQEANRFHFDAM